MKPIYYVRKSDIPKDEPVSLPLMVIKKPKNGASLRYFECENCGTEWIADHGNYILSDPITLHSNGPDSYVYRCFCSCPNCSCESPSIYMPQEDVVKLYEAQDFSGM